MIGKEVEVQGQPWIVTGVNQSFLFARSKDGPDRIVVGLVKEGKELRVSGGVVLRWQSFMGAKQ
jgi:hypothetical protein